MSASVATERSSLERSLGFNGARRRLSRGHVPWRVKTSKHWPLHLKYWERLQSRDKDTNRGLDHRHALIPDRFLQAAPSRV